MMQEIATDNGIKFVFHNTQILESPKLLTILIYCLLTVSKKAIISLQYAAVMHSL
jgi:hypothetical protein